MKKRLFLALTLLFTTPTLFAQQSKIDSLINLLKTDQADTTKLIHLCNICDESETIGNYPDGIKYGNQAIVLADDLIKSNKNEIILRTVNKYKAKVLNYIGLIYSNQGNYPEALKNYLSSLKIREALGDKKGIAYCYNNIGNVYYQQDNHTEALKNHFASLKIREELGDKKAMAWSYNNIGVVYTDQGNYSEALKNYFASLKIKESISDIVGIAACYNNIAQISCQQGNYSEALKNQLASLEIFEEIGDKLGIAGAYENLADINLKMNKRDVAKKYLEDALILAKEIGAKKIIRNIYNKLSTIDSLSGNYKSEIGHYKLYILYRDSLDNEETREKTIQSQMTYDFEKKEAVAEAEHKNELKNQALISEEKNRKQKLVTAFVIAGLLIVLMFAGFVFRSLRITRKQKLLIENQKRLVEEHQKEIIDSIHYAKRIQQSLLPTEKYIEKNIKRLNKR